MKKKDQIWRNRRLLLMFLALPIVLFAVFQLGVALFPPWVVLWIDERMAWVLPISCSSRGVLGNPCGGNFDGSICMVFEGKGKVLEICRHMRRASELVEGSAGRLSRREPEGGRIVRERIFGRDVETTIYCEEKPGSGRTYRLTTELYGEDSVVRIALTSRRPMTSVKSAFGGDWVRRLFQEGYE